MIETININKLKRVVEIIDKIPLFDDTIMDLTTIRRMTKDVIWSLECPEEDI